jgi:hypothetical protein
MFHFLIHTVPLLHECFSCTHFFSYPPYSLSRLPLPLPLPLPTAHHLHLFDSLLLFLFPITLHLFFCHLHRARGERALITYTIEAVRDMSFEILRTEKDMATHKKYVPYLNSCIPFFTLNPSLRIELPCLLNSHFSSHCYTGCGT